MPAQQHNHLHSTADPASQDGKLLMSHLKLRTSGSTRWVGNQLFDLTGSR